ncbi:hypothetical protein FRB95_004744 [Tulasnella sp. JGI-2019a]|nr:hypothetical protein FRB95_004744 [Tulasnella sp. JGI-2019a]
MSEEEEPHNLDDESTSLAPKRRKVSRPCDICRRRKIRCDAHSKPNMPKCSHCSTFKLECTFIQNAQKRGPPKGYVEDLEKRVKLLEQLIRRVAPTVDIDKEIGPGFDQDSWARTLRSTLPATAIPGKPNRYASGEDLEDSDNEKHYANGDGSATSHLESKMQKVQLDDGPQMSRRYHGKSSGLMLLQGARSLKEEVTGMPNSIDQGYTSGIIRKKFWTPSPWEWIASFLPPIDSLRFPPPDLIRTLVDHCFDKTISLLPVLHRPTFDRQYAEGMYRTDFNFAKLLLIVCSIGARHSKDPRVCLTSPEGEIEWNSAGWVYFAQVYQLQKPLLASAKLIDLQIMALSAIFLQGTSAPYGGWLVVGIGLRFAEDIGAHREKVYGPDHPFENQLWKRAFWCLVVMDQLFSAMFGRPACIYHEDIDTHLPLEVDDDSWDDTAQTWIQPAGKPSKMSYFIHHAKLMRILAHAVRTIYLINKSKVEFGFVGPEWEQRTVAELDSALNGWLDGIPDHLRWDPHMGTEFYQQAASLRVTYYHVQIAIHRQFLQLSSSSKRGSALSHASLAICTNAARSSAHILEAAMEMPAPPTFPAVALVAGVILLISIWEAQRSKLNVDISMQLQHVRTCMRYLKKWEKTYHFCGKQYDVLREMGSSVIDGEDLAPGSSSPPHRTLSSAVHQSTPSLSTPSTHMSTPPHIPPFHGSLPPHSSSSPLTNSIPDVLSHDVVAMQRERETASKASIDKAGHLMVDNRWDHFYIAGSGMQGLGVGPQRMPQPLNSDATDPMSPNSFLDGLLGGNSHPIGGSTPLMMEPGYWNNEPTEQWNWMSDIPGMFGLAPAVPHSHQ